MQVPVVENEVDFAFCGALQVLLHQVPAMHCAMPHGGIPRGHCLSFVPLRFSSLPSLAVVACLWSFCGLSPAHGQQSALLDSALRQQAVSAIGQAGRWYHANVAVHGGYVYYTSTDLKTRWGEGLATPTQIWVQPPGTPTVGLAYLRAWRATDDAFFLQAATEAAEALVYGQLQSGGWTNRIDFDPRGSGVAQYRNGRGRGRNYSTFDDGISQSALQLLIRVDEAHGGQHQEIHNAVEFGLQALLSAQFPNGGFPQVFTGPVGQQPVVQASYAPGASGAGPAVKDYWNFYTINDNVTGHIADTLITAMDAYGDGRYLAALRRLGDFLILAQLPQPQPGWSQQYNFDMQPIAARRFEPAAVAGHESIKVIETLLRIHEVTGDGRYLTPVPAALAWLQKSLLDDGQLPRYLELRTNRPLYMQRDGKKYFRTYDDSRLPRHYGWKTRPALKALTARWQKAREQPAGTLSGKSSEPRRPLFAPAARPAAGRIRAILASLDEQGRWISRDTGKRLVGQPKFRGADYLSSAVFSRNLSELATFVASPVP